MDLNLRKVVWGLGVVGIPGAFNEYGKAENNFYLYTNDQIELLNEILSF